MSDSWIVNNTVFENARNIAKMKALRQWETENFNLWMEYNTTINPNWIDPWNEHDVGGITNEYPDFLITQNMYYVYCWLKYKGYSDYAIIGIITTFIHESSLTGGTWEGGFHPYAGNTEYSSLVGYDAEDTNAGYYNQTWYVTGGGLVPSWTAETTDEVTGLDYSLTANAGTWDAVKGWPIATYLDEQDRRRPYIPLRFDRNGTPARYRGAGGGYGFAQWTLWTKLPTLSAHFGSEAPNHWQINATLQLMILEYQRELTAQGLSGGEWTSGTANNAILYAGANAVHYPTTLTWEQYASDSWLQWVDDTLTYYGITDPDTRDWGRRQMAIALWGACFEHGGEYNYTANHMVEISYYVKKAIEYWDSHDGWDVRDIPRPRDITECELDKFHGIPVSQMVLLTNRRRVKHVSTVLF